MQQIVGQLFGFVAIGVSYFIFQQKNRKRLLVFKRIADLLWVTHFALIGGYTAMATTGVGVARDLVFLQSGKGFFKSKLWLYLFLLAFPATLLFTYNGLLSIFPVLSSVIATVGFWCKKVQNTKKFALCQSVGMLLYNSFVGSVAGIVNEILVLTSIAISHYHNNAYKRGKKGNSYANKKGL